MTTETNAQHYQTPEELLRAKDAACINRCEFCRFAFENWPRTDPLYDDFCLARFGASPFGAPADIREPWPPPVDPNPL